MQIRSKPQIVEDAPSHKLFKMLALAGGFEAHLSSSKSTRMVMTPSIKTKHVHNIQLRIHPAYPIIKLHLT
jgi:hypothetical protein